MGNTAMFFQFLSNDFFTRDKRTRQINSTDVFTWLSLDPFHGYDIKVISCRGNYGHHEIRIDYLTWKLLEVTTIIIYDAKAMTIREELFPRNRFLQTKMPIHIKFSEPLDGWRVYDISEKCSVEVFQDAVVFNIAHGSSPCYFIYENELLGIITDKNLITKAIVSWNLKADELNTLKDFAKQYVSAEAIEEGILSYLSYADERLEFLSNDISEEAIAEKKFIINKKLHFKHRLDNKLFILPLDPKLELPKGCCMTYSKELIDKMLELQNVDYFELLYLGLKRELITERAVSDFAVRCLERDVMAGNELILELAGLVFDEYKQVPELLESVISDKEKIFLEKEPMYNKIWFYLTLVAEMKAENFVD